MAAVRDGQFTLDIRISEIVLNGRYVASGTSRRGRSAPATTAEPPRRQMLAAAIDCFARHGYQGTSIDRIAREVGVTKGALYYHFRDKEDLLFAAVTERVGEFERKVLRDVEPARDALTTLRRVVDACFFHATVSNHRRFIITLMVEALDTNPAPVGGVPAHPARHALVPGRGRASRAARGHRSRRRRRRGRPPR